MNTVRCLVIGGGHLGKIHASILRSLAVDGRPVQLAGIVDADVHRAASLGQVLGVPYAADMAELAGTFDAAVVATPTVTHATVAGELLSRGIHCLIEKPMATTMLECRRLIVAAETSGAVLSVGHVENFNPAWRAVREKLEDVQHVDAVRCGTYSGRSTDIGVVMDLMIHDLDLIAELADSPAGRVSGHAVAAISTHEDAANCHVQFRSGMTASLRASRIDEHLQRQMTVWCRERIVRIDFATASLRISEINASQRPADSLPVEQRLKVAERLFDSWLPTETIEVPAANAIEAELTQFIDAIGGRGSCEVDGYRGLRAVTLAEQVLAAADANAERREAHCTEQADRIYRLPVPSPAVRRAA